MGKIEEKQNLVINALGITNDEITKPIRHCKNGIIPYDLYKRLLIRFYHGIMIPMAILSQ